MKKGKMLLLAGWLVLSCWQPAKAQDDYALFRAEAGSASLLYRGQRAFVHNLLFNGTYYWSDPGFRPGSVVYNGKRYDDVSLNIDAARQDLLIRIPGSIIEKVVGESYTEEFTIAGSRYLNLRFLFGEEAPAGYWRVLHDGPIRLLQQVSKRLEPDLDGRKRNETGYDGVYRPNVYQVFIQKIDYCCLWEDGTIVPVRRRRDLLKQFDPTLRRDIRRHVKRREGSGLMSLENYCMEVLRYVETR